MLHGPAKRREIARSVLPSTHREPARAILNTVRRRNRRSINQDLRTIARAEWSGAVIDAFDGASADLRFYPNSDIRDVVALRRGGDKLGALFRWARATTAPLPIEDRLPAVRRLFPDNLIGRHAVSHLADDEHFHEIQDHERERFAWRYRHRGPGVDHAPRLRGIAAEILEQGDHAALNRWMKAHPTDKGATRVLAGAHDLDPFARDCVGEAEWKQALESFGAGRAAPQVTSTGRG